MPRIVFDGALLYTRGSFDRVAVRGDVDRDDVVSAGNSSSFRINLGLQWTPRRPIRPGR